MRVGRIQPGLRAKIGEGTVQNLQFLTIARLQRRGWIVGLRLGLRGELVDGLFVGSLRPLDFCECRTLQKRFIRNLWRTIQPVSPMDVNPCAGQGQDKS